MLTRTYTPIWHKYRPVILKMMIDSKAEPKTYQLSDHEFKALNSRRKGGYTFTLLVADGKVQNNIRDNEIAQDLWEILQLSPTAIDLIASNSYQFIMDKNYQLRIEFIAQAH